MDFFIYTRMSSIVYKQHNITTMQRTISFRLPTNPRHIIGYRCMKFRKIAALPQDEYTLRRMELERVRNMVEYDHATMLQKHVRGYFVRKTKTFEVE